MHDKVAIVTGATSGIGLETARSLAQEGYTVVMACRDKEKGACLAAEIIEQSGNPNLEVLHAEMASLQSVKTFAEFFAANYDQLHVLVNNAGGFNDRLQKTVNGFEMTMGVNYLVPYFLTKLLLPLLKKTPGARIVNIGSKAAFFAKIKLDENTFTNNTYGFKA